jgi:GT2 family glycosyltransferase
VPSRPGLGILDKSVLSVSTTGGSARQRMESRERLADAGGAAPHLGELAPRDNAADASVDLSVVVPCLNAAALLPLQLEALSRQEWQGAWEVIVVDNGSTDATRDIAVAFAGRVRGLRVVDASARRGRHYACNIGVGEARGPAIVFVDADDEVAPSYVAEMARALSEHDVVAARLDHLALDPAWMADVGSTFQTKGLEDGFGFLPFGAGCSLGFQRSVFEAVGGFRERARYCEDVDICWRAQLAGYRIEFVPSAVVHYRSRTSLLAMFRQHRNFGRARALLYHDYRSEGMPPRPSKLALGEWWFIARAIPRLRSRAEAARWFRRLGRCVGRLQGSLRYRVWYP